MSTAPTSLPVSATRPRGRRTLRVGIAIMVVAAVAIALSVGAWLVLGKTSTDGAEVVDVPGSFSKELTAGDWAFYSEYIDGSAKILNEDEVVIDGPGEVTKTATWGFYGDATTI